MKILDILYQSWMKFAKALGRVQTAIILFLIYFIGVGATAVIAFILRKDLLDKKFIDRESFWNDRHDETLDMENFEKQF